MNESIAGVVRMLFCDFCGISQKQSGLLIQGRNDVYICDQCAIVCLEILEAQKLKQQPKIDTPPATNAVASKTE